MFSEVKSNILTSSMIIIVLLDQSFFTRSLTVGFCVLEIEIPRAVCSGLLGLEPLGLDLDWTWSASLYRKLASLRRQALNRFNFGLDWIGVSSPVQSSPSTALAVW